LPDIELLPGESVTIGHGIDATADIILNTGDEQLVRAVAPPPPPEPDELEFWLIDPANEGRVSLLANGATIQAPFAIEIVPTIAGVESVRITANGVVRVENSPPYAAFGDNQGDFTPAPDMTSLTLRAEAFSANNAGGTLLADQTITLTVTEEETEPPPDPPPTGDIDGTTTAGAWGIPLLPLRPNMKVLGYTNFDEKRSLGDGFGPKLNAIWDPKREGWPDSSTRGTYSVAHTYEERDSLGRFFVHSAMAGGDQKAHNPMGKTHYVYAPVSRFGNLGETFVQFTCRFPTIPGRKMAHLYWNKGKEENGEIDIPEGKLDGGGDKGNMFIHYFMSTRQDTAKLHLSLQDEHHYGCYFRRKGFRGANDPGEIEGFVDGKSIYHLNSAAGIPDGMFHVTQFETYLKGQDIPGWDKEDNTYRGQAGSGWAEYDKFRIDGPA
jgi:hypothetical protein